MYRKENYVGICICAAFLFCIIVLSVVGYIKNIINLAQCDFQSPYKCEAIYGVGLVTGVGAITGWIDVGEK